VAPDGPTPPPDAGEYEPSFADWLFHRAGLDPACYKPDSLARRVPACLRALGVDATARARALLRRRPELVPKALDAALVGVTQFFRDADVFATLARDVLPALIRDAATTPIRAWSAGCSTGKELYSVAMLLSDLGVTPARARLLGTDARAAAVDAARAGRFADAAVDAVPPDLRDRHFTGHPAAPPAARWRVGEPLRAMTDWRTGNLLARVEPGPWDLVLCRNVAIYLRPDAAARLWQGLASVVRPGGFLVLGRAERPAGVPGLAMVRPCVYRRVAGLGDATASNRTGGQP
jgi:chemotaxis methyl-accepting protein methylase